MTTMYLDFEALLEPWLEQWPVSILTLLVIVLGVYLYRKLPKSIVPLTLSIIAICQVIQVVHLIYSLKPENRNYKYSRTSEWINLPGFRS